MTEGPESCKAYAREHLIEIEDALLWYEENLQIPSSQLFWKHWGIPSESPGLPTRTNEQARALYNL